MAPSRNLHSLMIITILFCLIVVSPAFARPAAPGHKLNKGHIPTTCTEADIALGASVYGSSYGYYFSSKAKSWIQIPWCYPRWGNLIASPSIVVKFKGKKKPTVTVTAIPTDGSNSAEYAPITNSISWTYTGKLVSGCGNSDLQCTFVPFKKQTTEWQWAEVHVTMPRTFFIDHPGSNCAGQHICAGFTTNAWSWVGLAPKK